VFDAAPQLRVIARVGVGTDSIDLDAATRAGVAVTTTPGANNQTTADHALAMMLAAIRRIVENDASMRRGEWSRAAHLTPWDLHGKTVGIVGFGDIGIEVARRLEGFDTSILVTDPARSSADGFELVELEDLLRRAEIVSLHVPLSESTRGMIGEGELALLGPAGILVNTSRGALVDESALTTALETGRLRAAALDVFEDEPPTNTSLLALPNIVVSPHIGGLSDRSITAMTQHATQSVLDVLSGLVPDGVVNPAALERHAASGARDVVAPARPTP
jgi:phosphoglycerate dehydrogenase-like enzyme